MIPIRGDVRCTATPPVTTVALIVTNVVVFLYEVSLPEPVLNALLFDLGVVPIRQVMALQSTPGAIELWLVPVLTSMFLHGGWLHLIGNMLFLWVFGDGVESRLGPVRFLVFYLLVGAAASQAQVWADPLAQVPMVGASGAISGVLGAYVLLCPWARVTVLFPVLFIPLFFEVPALVFVALWFLEQVYMVSLTALTPVAGSASEVAWWAHIGGAAGGIVLVRLLGRPERRPPKRFELPPRNSLWDRRHGPR